MSELFARAATHLPLMAILRGYDPARTVELCRAAWRAGAELVEVPVQDERAYASLEAAVAAGREAGRDVGAGTVTDASRVRAAHRIGAAFTVAPGYDRHVAWASRDHDMPHLPGVATATEVHRAVADGHLWVKAFPAEQLGPGWISAMAGPFPQVQFVATGGVGRANARAFLDAGAKLVAVGQAIETFDDSWGLPASTIERTP